MAKMIQIERRVVNSFQENTYIVYTDEAPGCILVDPAAYTKEERDSLYARLEQLGRKPEAILLTHGHIDHILQVGELQARYGAAVYMNREDDFWLSSTSSVCLLTGLRNVDTSFHYEDLQDGQQIEAAGLCFTVIRTPGHSRGCCCFLVADQQVMFTGDTLFAGTIGRSDLPGGDYDEEMRSIMQKLMPMDGDIRIYPGHGLDSSIGEERALNPMLDARFDNEEAAAQLNELENNSSHDQD